MNQEDLDKIYVELDNNVNYSYEIAQQTVGVQTKELDKLMKDIYDDIINQEDPPTINIEKYFLSLSNCLYFLGDRLEKVGLYDDLSRTQAKEKYNNAYIDQVNQVGNKKVTVAEAQTSAENQSLYENMVNIIYARSYKIFKYKIDAAQTMLSSLSKMLSKRMQDQQMQQITPNISTDQIKKYLIES